MGTYVGDFTDGTFEELARLQGEIAALDWPDTEDPALNMLISMVTDPASLLESAWRTSGDVQLTDDGSGLVSWYSSHETDAEGKKITAIYLANLKRK